MNLMLLSGVMDYTQPIEGWTERLSFGGMMVLLGMATVFAVLIVILIALMLFRLFFHDLPNKKKSGAKQEAVAPIPETIAPTPTEEEIIAVMTAAIAMAESENSGIKFRVVSFRRV